MSSSAILYLLVISVATLALSALLLKSAVRRGSHRRLNWTDEQVSFDLKNPALDLEVSARVFGSEDFDFVRREAPGQYALRFGEERTVLALDWLHQVRTHVNRFFRAYRRAARGNRDLKPTDELKLVFEVLLFQLMSGILWWVIWFHGPLHAAKLLGWSLELTGKLRRITEAVLPAATSVGVEIIKTDP